LCEAVLEERENRFVARIRRGEERARAHVPNSGRLRELLFPGARVLVREAKTEGRVTHYDLVMVELPHTLVCIDTRLPPRVLEEAILAGKLHEFAAYGRSRREVTFGSSRLDLRLEGEEVPCFVETKLVTLVEEGRALFPDAPTSRGRRHMEELVLAHREGYRAAAVFILQREDARDFAPHGILDPEFASTLRWAVDQGVEAHTYACRITREEVTLQRRLPLVL
jgi:sugar fermentation stimulation protein A